MAAELPDSSRRVLLLAPTARDGEATRSLLASAGLDCVVCETLERVCAETAAGAGAVIVPEEVVLSDEADVLAAQLRQQPVWSDVPIILLSRAGVESHAVEKALATLGNVTLIERPMRVSTLLSAVRAALRARERQYQVREHLDARRMVEFRFQRLIEHSPQSTQLFHPDGRPRQVNQAFERLFGITQDELRDYNILRDPELARLGVTSLMERAFAGQPVTIEPIPYVPDRGQYAGQTRWAGAYVYPVKDEAGRVEEVVLVHDDVTERKRAEDELRESEQRFRLMADAIPQIVWVTDADGRAMFLNRQWTNYTGAPFDPATAGEVAAEFIHPDDRAATMDAFVEAQRTGSTFSAEHRIRSKAGEYRWFMVRADPYRDPQAGRITRWFGASVDIHDRRLAEDALRASEERFRQLADAMPQMVWVTRPDGYHEFYNERWYEFTGVPRGSTDGEGWNGMFHPDDQDRAWAAWRGSLATGEPYEVEYRLRHHSGEYRWTLGRALPIRDAGDAITKWFGTCTDIDAIKRLQQEREHLLDSERSARADAERASRMKDEFLATLSHELRTPLNAILGWSQILAGGVKDPEDLAEGLQTIERNARAQTQIIEDLLDMSRIISGKVRLDVQRINIATVVHGAVESIKPTADAKGIRLEAVLDPAGGPVSGDPNRLQQVMWNLLTNAVKFTPRGGRVQVVVKRVNSHLEVGVADTGEGIKPEFLPHVFDRFRQADASTTRRHGGLGLGLAIVKQLVELHGGSIRANSPGLGMGATFTVSLPVGAIKAEPGDGAPRHQPGAAAPNPASRDVCGSLAGVRVLVVDDEPDARNLVRRFLEDCGALVTTAGSASEAMKLIRAEPPDVVVSDIGMPGEDGYAFIRQVRALGPQRGGDVPAVALTAYARSEDRMRSVLAGFHMHVAKPVEPAELITMVASLAGRTR